MPITKSATFLATNQITGITPVAEDALKLAVKPKTGDMTGTFIHAVSKRSTSVKGVLFQKQQKAFSFFKGTSVQGVNPQTGYLLLEQPQP